MSKKKESTCGVMEAVMGGMNRDILRLLDANLNRAVEGIRVLEEAARMLRNDSVLTRELKDLRHALVGIVREGGDLDAQLLFARNSEGDVLREGETPSERARAGLDAVIRANAGRAQEAVRSLEEYVKLVRPELSVRFKGIRFGLYDVEKKLALLSRARDLVNDWRLGVLVILDRAEADGLEIGDLARIAADAGAGTLIYRDKRSGGREMLRNAERMVSRCRGQNVACLVNDRLDVSLLASADGILVGAFDLPPGRCREAAGRGFAVGVSLCHAAAGDSGLADDADFVLTGPVRARSEDLAGLDTLVRSAGAPVVAAGSFDDNDIGTVLATGVVGVAVQPGRFDLRGLAGTVSALRGLVESHRGGDAG